eukprot:CAMPEP_0197245118 /NCGR_PEP_ID=MMETSP1429-20130617/10011_1 /TAXON_ID=49237 /ORGANISM="Chaetoceros  sp., Strain UNC1202" /LENGTH=133 /DNA_ID=CAMNT_0042705561 /DNA_START=38 /DNA_END=439 /DNA_ORIENTATION=+
MPTLDNYSNQDHSGDANYDRSYNDHGDCIAPSKNRASTIVDSKASTQTGSSFHRNNDANTDNFPAVNTTKRKMDDYANYSNSDSDIDLDRNDADDLLSSAAKILMGMSTPNTPIQISNQRGGTHGSYARIVSI